MAKLLLVEDDEKLANKMVRWLKQDGHSVESTNSGADGLQMLQIYKFDLAIIDWGLPEITGIELLKQFRAGKGITPIIFLTGRGDLESKKHGLDSGADDYISKPFDLEELSARVRSILRRPPALLSTILTVGNVDLDLVSKQVRFLSRPIILGRMEHAILEFLMRHPDRAFSSKELLEHVYPSDTNSTEVAVRSCIKNLRDKLSAQGVNCIIKHVQNSGYSARE